MTKRQAARDAIVLLAVAIEGGLVVAAVGLGWVFERHPLSHCWFDLAAVLWGLGAVGPLLLIFAVLDRWPVGPFAELKTFSEQTIRPMLAPCTLVDLVGISCLAGLGEEMIFRGLLQDGLEAELPTWLAIWLTSVAFGLVHAVTPTYALVATVMGAYLGWLYVATGNLLTPIVTHGVYDLAVLVYLLRGPGADEAGETGEEELEAEEEYEDSQ